MRKGGTTREMFGLGGRAFPFAPDRPQARAGGGIPWRRVRRLLVVFGGVGAVIALLAFGFTRDPRAIPSPLVGRPAPSFSLALLNGGSLELDALRGKVVVVNFWASWCFPACVNEAPRLEAAWRRYRDDGVLVVGVAYQDSETNARQFIARHGKTYPSGLDQGSRIAVDYGVYGVPETFFIDRTGRISKKHVGEIDDATLRTTIESLLNEATGDKGAARPWHGAERD